MDHRYGVGTVHHGHLDLEEDRAQVETPPRHPLVEVEGRAVFVPARVDRTA